MEQRKQTSKSEGGAERLRVKKKVLQESVATSLNISDLFGGPFPGSGTSTRYDEKLDATASSSSQVSSLIFLTSKCFCCLHNTLDFNNSNALHRLCILREWTM